jgi:DNA-binding transcriptional LysR family regulator
MFNIRSVDLNLLPVLEAVYEEKNLSRAAVRLAMTQSAVSHALGRLRFVFRDELFVRQARGVLPTPGADRIYAKLRNALASVRESVTDARGFDSKTSERRFVIAIAHPLGPLIEWRLQERLAKIAPLVAISASTRSRPVDLDRALRTGRIDASIDWLAPREGQFNSKLLFDDAMIAVARKGHPAFRSPVSPRILREGRFVGLRPRLDEQDAPPQIQALHRLNLNVALEVSEILEVFMVVGQSDLFGLVPRSMKGVAQSSFGLRELTGLRLGTTLPINLYWSASREADPAHTFLRNELSGIAKRVAQHS